MFSKEDKKINVLIAAGGTGGHLFPAIAIAEEIQSEFPKAEFLFVGTKTRMEKDIIPKLGYKYFGTSIKGMPRKLGIDFVLFGLSFIQSFFQALVQVLRFKPKVAIGTGSYISVPPLLASKISGAKLFLSESNSLPGVATKFLAPLATEIFLSFEQSKKYFRDKSKLFVTGTPIRKSIEKKNKEEALKYFELSPDKKTILVLGGSLGAKTINEKIKEILPRLIDKYQLIWQTGKRDFDLYKDFDKKGDVRVFDFIDRMDYAYSVCDLLISRSGASTISEIISNGIPAILIPSPNVTENHQYFNAMELVENNAAEIHLDNQSADGLYNLIINLIEDDERLKRLSENARAMFDENASKKIVERIKKYLN